MAGRPDIVVLRNSCAGLKFLPVGPKMLSLHEYYKQQQIVQPIMKLLICSISGENNLMGAMGVITW